MFAQSRCSTTNSTLIMILGALKATAGRGLQPAMDHILEHEGDPVPDLSATSSSSSAPAAAGGADDPMDEDDEDAEALKSLGVVAGNAVEAKVCGGSVMLVKVEYD